MSEPNTRGVDLVAALALPRPAPLFGGVTERDVRVPHVALGLWTGLALVLVLPNPRGKRYKVTESALMRSYGTAMTVFGLL